ncbi:ornithine cyclodeaminase family protein [Chloroflexota bacterium]
MRIRILSGADVRRAVTMAEAIQTVREAYVQLAAGDALVPLRTPIPVDSYEGVTLFMPAYLASSNALGAKIVSVFPGNAAQGLPTIHAAIIVVEAETGRPTALIDGTYLTALRTGAASGVATDLLARQDARVAAIFGAGAQARTQLEAICTVRSINKVWVYDTVFEAAVRFAEDMGTRGLPIPTDISAAKSPKQAVQEADVVCTATTSTAPVFDDADLKPGVHINGIGSYTPAMQEIPGETVARARVVVDSRSACLAEAGDLVVPLRLGLFDESGVYGQIGDIAAGRLAARSSSEEITFFKSVGVAVQDVSVAALVLRRAEELRLGVEVEM